MSALATCLDGEAEPRVIAQKYRLESLIGEGGMGEVWRAFNLQLDVPVAIKLLRPGLNAEELGERLRVEARAAAKLVHPSIVRIFDIGEAESGEPFIVMELLAGESLGDVLERGALPAINAVQLLLPIAEALSLAHSRGVVHRDLKPDNIFLAREGEAVQPKLLDFGIAKVTSSGLGNGATLTQAGTLLGSPDYMSPEQAYGRSDIDHRSDVWSFCIVLYQAITGHSPFAGSTCQNTLRSVVQDEPLPPEMLCEVDPELSQLVLAGLAKDREQRPASIFDLGQQLATWLYAQGIHEDATGASLEAKWLGRVSETLLLTRPHAVSTPRAQHDHATLVSVVHPQPRCATEPILTLNVRRRRRWVPSAMVAGAALLCYAGWASMRGLNANARGLAGTPTADEMAAPAPAGRMAAAVPAVPVESLPVEPGAVAQPAAEQPAVPPQPTVAQRVQPQRQPAVQLTATIRQPLSAEPPKQALPQSLPPAAAPRRDTGDDLLEPY